MFKELAPLVRHRAVLLTISHVENDLIRVNVIPKKVADGDNDALTTPVSVTGTVEDLDRELPQTLLHFVSSHLELKNSLERAKAEMDEASKAARAEARKKSGSQITKKDPGGNYSKPAVAAEAPTPAKAEPPTETMDRRPTTHGLPLRHRRPTRTRRFSGKRMTRAKARKATKPEELLKPLVVDPFSRRNPQPRRWAVANCERGRRHATPIHRWICSTRRERLPVPRNRRSPDVPARRSFVTYLFALCSPMLLSMFEGLSARKTFVVACKKCRRDVPTGVGDFPFQSNVVECPLCGERRRYLPSEVFLGRVDQLVNRQKRAGAV